MSSILHQQVLLTISIDLVQAYILYICRLILVNQGNSGGPVITTDGQKVAGIVVSILSPGRQIPGWDGVGLAVTSEISQRAINYIFDNYKEGEPLSGSMQKSFFRTFTYDELKENGQLELDKKDRRMIYFHMDDNEEGSAYEAGIRNGDVILELNGEIVRSPFLMIQKAILAFGDEFTYKVRRGDEELEFTFVLPEKTKKKCVSGSSNVISLDK